MDKPAASDSRPPIVIRSPAALRWALLVVFSLVFLGCVLLTSFSQPTSLERGIIVVLGAASLAIAIRALRVAVILTENGLATRGFLWTTQIAKTAITAVSREARVTWIDKADVQRQTVLTPLVILSSRSATGESLRSEAVSTVQNWLTRGRGGGRSKQTRRR